MSLLLSKLTCTCGAPVIFCGWTDNNLEAEDNMVSARPIHICEATHMPIKECRMAKERV